MFINSFFASKSLSEVKRYVQNALAFVTKAKISDFSGIVKFWDYMIQCMEKKATYKLEDIDAYEQKIIAGKSKTELCFFYIYSTKLNYLLGNTEAAIRSGRKYKLYAEYSLGMVSNVECLFYYALAMISQYKNASLWQRYQYLRELKKIRNQIKRWASWCPINFKPYLLLLEAELAHIQKNNPLAMRLYEQTIKAAREQNVLFLAAVISECSGTFYRDLKMPKVAHFYFAEAYSLYGQWGAIVKCELLEQTYPEFAHIPKNLITPIIEDDISASATTQSLDMIAILKSAQIISSEIQLDRLLQKLLLVVLENAGAQRGVILVKKGDKWLVEAEGNLEQQQIYLNQVEKMNVSKNIPLTLLNYVQRTMEPVIIQEATRAELTMLDPYIQKTRPQSLLMIPLSYQGKLCRILYLEHKDSSYAFTTRHLQSLQLLASQAMISLENAGLYHQVTHDPLTGLANRSSLHQFFQYSANHIKRTNGQIALFFLDLDNFKTINDSLGHEVGDKLLIYVSEKLTECLRVGDVAARLGGDEFAVMLVGIEDVSQVKAVADRFYQVLKEPVNILGHRIRISSSMGICMYPKDAKDIQTMLKLADIALYQAKEKGKNQYYFFSTSLQEQYQQIHSLEVELKRALENKQLCLYYQPILDITTGHLLGLEALLRWHHPNRGLLEAKDFIETLEKNPLIFPVSEWVMRTACEQAKLWHKLGLLKVPLAVNVSAAQFRQPISQLITSLLKEVNLKPQYLELELTESTFIECNDKIFAEIDALRDLGVKLVIDDFGTGYSSLGYLKKLPVSKIKIDRSFFHKSENDFLDQAIIQAITALAHRLQMLVIAEGIENDTQLKIVRQQGIDAIQGYYFSRPLSTEKCQMWLENEKIKIIDRLN